MKTKAIKIDHSTWEYRGFTISRNYTSEYGTSRVCNSQRGVRVTPGQSAFDDWSPSITAACERIDYLYSRFFELSHQGKWVVVQAVRVLQKRRKASLAG